MASSILSCRVRHSLACGFARTCRRVVYYVARTRDNVACYIGGSGNNITDNISGAGDCVTYGVACVCNRILRGGASSISVSGNGSVLLLPQEENTAQTRSTASKTAATAFSYLSPQSFFCLISDKIIISVFFLFIILSGFRRRNTKAEVYRPHSPFLYQYRRAPHYRPYRCNEIPSNLFRPCSLSELRLF